jgi:elongation factor Ts
MSISAKDVMKLREMTGAGMMDCKEALGEVGGDFDTAVEYLRKKGLAKAAKKADRATNEGLVHAIVSPDGKSGAMVIFNCETDFVARNEEFVKLVNGLTEQALASASKEVSAETLMDEPYRGGGGSVSEVISAAIAKLGENMKLTRAVQYRHQGQGRVYAYIHPGARTGVLIEVGAGSPGTADKPEYSQTVRDLAMQCAAMMPRWVRREAADTATLDKEREIFRAQLAESGKPAQVIDKIVEGKIDKFFAESCLLEQAFIKDQDRKVHDVVAAAGKQLGDTLEVVRFSRFSLGDGA